LPFLGDIPLDPVIRVQSDGGKPVALDETSVNGKAFREVAAALAEQVSAANQQAISIE
jgi:septum formation inhibitor-activating ATPase MinD